MQDDAAVNTLQISKNNDLVNDTDGMLVLQNQIAAGLNSNGAP